MEHLTIESDSKESLEAAITIHEDTGWELIRVWVDEGVYCALMEATHAKV